MAFSSLVGELGKLIKVWYNVEGNGGSALAIHFPWPKRLSLGVHASGIQSPNCSVA